MNELLLGTTNRGKLEEMRTFLAGLSLKLQNLDAFPQILPVDETGKTYEENAVLKALSYARQTGLSCLAEDSGLEVDALGQLPGVLSARHAGLAASDQQRINLLLDQLLGTPASNRTARFICVAAIADSAAGLAHIEYGVCEGSIAGEPRGSNGFGYDPIFIPSGYQMTFAELSSETKNEISHRAQALKATRVFLRDNKLNVFTHLTRGLSNS